MDGLKLYAASPSGHFTGAHGEYVWKPNVWRGGVWFWRAKPPEWGWVPSDIPYALPRGKWQESYMEYIRTTIPRGTWDHGPGVPYNRKPKMTRDEAVEKAHSILDFRLDHQYSCGIRKDLATSFVDMAVALGVLKLDEPKSDNQKIMASVLSIRTSGAIQTQVDDLVSALDHHRLRIVPK
jgi:hypothetical protein